MTQPAPQRYQITERIDAGGMAEVFKGKVTSLKGFEKEVAIKRILPSLTQDPRFVRMFLDEAKLSLYLNHTNIVQVFDIGQADETYFIVMEYIDGTNLKTILNYMAHGGHRIPNEQAAYIAIEVCKGLAHAHDKKSKDGQPLQVVHRDISPPNILISRDGEVKITDFGLAKAVIQLEHTDPGIVKGKFGYLSPEAAHGQEVDLRTDVFAVGIVLWEMLAGRRLFLGETDFKTLELVREAHVPPLNQHTPDVPPALDQIVRKALARDPDQRYGSARELGSELAKFIFGQGRSVTNFDLSAMVQQAMDQQRQTTAPAPVKDSFLDLLIQTQIDKFISVEERQDFSALNIVGATPLTMDDLGGGSSTAYPSYGFEDPRTWSDMQEADDKPLEFDLSASPADPGSSPEALDTSGRVAPLRRPTTESPQVGSAPRQVGSNPGQAVAPPPKGSAPAEEEGTPAVFWIIFIVLLVLVVIGLGVLVFTLL